MYLGVIADVQKDRDCTDRRELLGTLAIEIPDPCYHHEVFGGYQCLGLGRRANRGRTDSECDTSTPLGMRWNQAPISGHCRDKADARRPHRQRCHTKIEADPGARAGDHDDTRGVGSHVACKPNWICREVDGHPGDHEGRHADRAPEAHAWCWRARARKGERVLEKVL